MRLRLLLAALPLALLGCLDRADDDVRMEAPSDVATDRASHETDLRITLQADGTVLLGATPLDRETLRTRVQRRVAAAMQPVHVTLAAPAELPPEQVGAMVARLEGWGVDEVEIALAAPEGGG